jgi:hypothetical protein
MNIEPREDDVLHMEPGVNPVRTRTFITAQIIQAIKTQFQPTLSSSPASTADAWFQEGVECELLDAMAGGGWKKGKIRLRLEFIPDEPNPPESSALVPSLNSDQ